MCRDNADGGRRCPNAVCRVRTRIDDRTRQQVARYTRRVAALLEDPSVADVVSRQLQETDPTDTRLVTRLRLERRCAYDDRSYVELSARIDAAQLVRARYRRALWVGSDVDRRRREHTTVE